MNNQNIENTIINILEFIIDNCSSLSLNKFSGVQLDDDYYSVHETDFIPKVLGSNNYSRMIENIILTRKFSRHVVWDRDSLWLYIY